MAVKRKSSVPFGIKLREDLAARLEDYKVRTGVSKTFVIEKALDEYFDRVDPRPVSEDGS